MPVPIYKLRRWGALATALLLVSGVLAACGGGSDDDSSSSGGATAAQTTEAAGGGGAGATLIETAQESGGLSFSRSDLTAQAGSVTVTLDNPSGNQLPHAIEIEGNGVEEETDTIQPGGRDSVTVDLRPGRYEFYCPVGNHRQQGMEGTLTVS
ncbi:MAG TPA: plastocyanin/azurin family copper-binding protein [Conexibacter sp.]|nr:plastocyanin/azurin family copper-binding protein [Conexibacter sp.]